MAKLLPLTLASMGIFALCLLMAGSAAGSPAEGRLSVHKVEPSNWWVGMKWNRVQLMLYGENLREISAQFDSPALKVAAVHTLANPSYAFLDVVIPGHLSPGSYGLVIHSGAESARTSFPALKRTSDPRRHAGFGPKDVIYLITPDRFSNGDPANDRLEDRFHDFDPHAEERARELLTTFWFTDRMPDLNQRNPWLAAYLIQNTLWWIEFSGLDGIREDTYPYAFPDFQSDWAKAVLEEYPRFNIVGEIWDESAAFIARFQRKTLFPRDFPTNLPAGAL